MRSVQVLCINEVIATKKVTKKVKKWWKIAILWLFLSHRGCHMAPRPQKHEYLLATMFCTKFEHFRMSGSIICTQLFLSLTRCFKGTSFFIGKIICPSQWEASRVKKNIKNSTFKAILMVLKVTYTLQTKCKTCFGGPRMVLHGPLKKNTFSRLCSGSLQYLQTV